MYNNRQSTDNNHRLNLGKTLIKWIRMINERKRDRCNRSNSYKNRRSSDPQYSDLLPVEIETTD